MAGLMWRWGLLEKPPMAPEAAFPAPGMRPNWVTIMLAQVAYSSLPGSKPQTGGLGGACVWHTALGVRRG